jgi:hypothetical protein
MTAKIINKPVALMLGIVGLLAFYILSVGPAVYCERYGGGWYSHVIGVIYAPITPLQFHSQIYNDYVMWWWKLGMGQP